MESRASADRRLCPSAARYVLLVAVLTLGSLLGAGASSDAQVQVTWEDTSGGEAAFMIERKDGMVGAFVQIATQPPGAASYTDTSLLSGALYCYRVKAFSEAGESEYSDETCGTTEAGFDHDRPYFAQPESGTRLQPGGVVTLAWTALSGVTRYGVEFTGTNRRFANPKGSTPDSENGFGGVGGGFLVDGTAVTLTVPSGIPHGAYELRVIGLAAGRRILGRFSDAVTLVIGP
jgi:hypothetical protein